MTMYVPRAFAMVGVMKQHQFITEFGFGIMISTDDNHANKYKLQATHLPFILNSNEGKYGTLYSHMARSNSHWKTLAGEDVLVTFSGPHSYISPIWYQASPAVPTWNYVSVHVHGKVELLNQEETLWAVDEIVKQYEANLLNSDTIMPDEYKNKLLASIVGVKVAICRIEGQQKLGQHRNVEDQKGVYTGLSKSDRIESLALANYMSKYKIGMGL